MRDMLLLHASDNIRNAAEKVLQLYSPSIEFCCLPHIVTARKRVCRTISNIFLNNEQKILTSSIRKDVHSRHVKSRRDIKQTLFSWTFIKTAIFIATHLKIHYNLEANTLVKLSEKSVEL